MITLKKDMVQEINMKVGDFMKQVPRINEYNKKIQEFHRKMAEDEKNLPTNETLLEEIARINLHYTLIYLLTPITDTMMFKDNNKKERFYIMENKILEMIKKEMRKKGFRYT